MMKNLLAQNIFSEGNCNMIINHILSEMSEATKKQIILGGLGYLSIRYICDTIVKCKCNTINSI